MVPKKLLTVDHVLVSAQFRQYFPVARPSHQSPGVAAPPQNLVLVPLSPLVVVLGQLTLGSYNGLKNARMTIRNGGYYEKGGKNKKNKMADFRVKH